MAKKKEPRSRDKQRSDESPASTAGSSSASTPAAHTGPLLDFEQRFEAGDYSATRRLATAALSSADADVQRRAKEMLEKIKFDPRQAIFAFGMIGALIIVFGYAILYRNSQLSAGPPPEYGKALIQLEPTPATTPPAPPATPAPAATPPAQDSPNVAP